jgi:superfamily II DNA or RNA helicase
MLTLRPYQLQYISKISQSFAKGNKRVVLALTTGGGKTAIFSEMIRLAAQRNKSILVLTDRIELFKQTLSSISRVQLAAQLIDRNSKKFSTEALINVAMVETLARRKNLPLNPDLLICDEAHKGNFTKILDRFPYAYVIGATATPVGKHFYKYYTDIVQCIDTPELIEQGFLVPCKGYEMKDDFSDLEMKAGEFTEESLFKHFNKRKLYEGVIEKYKEVADGKKTIVFCVNIEHTIQTYQSFIDAGINAVFVTSKSTPEERKQAITAFSKDYATVMVNCGILTTGYDEPSIECVIMNRKTASLPLWLQCCGRGSRPFPGKSHFIVIDFGQNFTFHGLWDEPRKWELKPPSKKKKLSAAPLKECPSCYCMLPANAKICQFCNHQFPISDTILHTGKLVEVQSRTAHLIGKSTDTLSLQELFACQQEKKFKPSYIWRIVRARGKESIAEYAKIAKYGRGWVYHQSKKIEDSQFKTLIVR